MKIEFLTQDSPLYILPFFEEFFRSYWPEFEISQVSCCRAMGKRSRTRLLREMIGLYGPVGFARLGAWQAAAKALGRLPRGRESARFYTLEQLCAAYGTRFERIGNPNDPAFVSALGRRSPELLVSVACPYILKQALLGTPPLGCINIHHAPLPRYQGMMPTFWQMYHGENSVGVTIHYMTVKLDEGPALLRDRLAIEPGESLDHLIRRSKRHGAHCMARALRDVEARRAAPAEPGGGEASYFTFPSAAEIREFRRRGYRAL